MTPANKRELELLAPARNIDIGIAAIDCGADAVYIAGPRFGARQAAGNEIEDISRLCTYAHKFGSRIFITLNTILFDDELEDAASQLAMAEEAGADAIIVQDLAVMEIAGRTGISLPLHASTQCAIRTPDQAKFYEDAGFSRLILERELSLDQISEIRKAVSCELEFFVHGALCVCYSGQCYMSEAIAGRSANRGACIQACRSMYDLADEQGNILVRNKALLSLKDYNLKNRLKDLADAGISSFKIEGRLKNASYVKNIVRDYSSAIDRLISASENKYCRASFGNVTGGFTPDPDKTFNRGYTELFIDGKRSKWSTFDSAKGMGEEIGRVVRVSPEKNRITIRPTKQLTLHNGDGLSFVAGNSEVVGFRADVCSGLEIKCKTMPELYEGAILFRNIDTAFEKELETNLPSREIGVRLSICIHRNTDDGHYVIETTATSEDGRVIRFSNGTECQPAGNQERMAAVFRQQLEKKSGHYRFSVSDIRTESCILPFLPASALNGMRREIAAKLDESGCISRPLENRTASRPLAEHSFTAGIKINDSISYKSNVSNKLAEERYLKAGACAVDKAFELEHQPDAELMRMRYCIRHELGLCPKQNRGLHKVGELFLLNNGKRFPLLFDCRKCEMAVLPNSPISRK